MRFSHPSRSRYSTVHLWLALGSTMASRWGTPAWSVMAEARTITAVMHLGQCRTQRPTYRTTSLRAENHCIQEKCISPVWNRPRQWLVPTKCIAKASQSLASIQSTCGYSVLAGVSLLMVPASSMYRAGRLSDPSAIFIFVQLQNFVYPTVYRPRFP
jgi:hypothetical protein